jgi:hypothetical protein
MCLAAAARDSGRAGGTSANGIEEMKMHQATVSLLLMAIVLFPCFLSMATPE